MGDSLYVVGGRDHNEQKLSSVLRYDVKDERWVECAPMPSPRSGFAMCTLGECLYVAGGSTGTARGVADCLRYDVQSDTWEAMAPMQVGRYGCNACAVGGKIYAVGGFGDYGGGVCTGATECFDPATGQWTRLADMPTPRGWSTSFVLDGSIYVAGASQRGEVADVHLYDVASDTWSRVCDLPAKIRYGAALSLIHI